MTVHRPTSTGKTFRVLELVALERIDQEERYGERNVTAEDGTGPDTCWLLPYTGAAASVIQSDLREDYEDYEEEAQVTWLHLVREEVAEAFQEQDPERLLEELVQVAALCVSWAERLLD